MISDRHQYHLNKICALIQKELRVELVSGYDLSVLVNDQKVIEKYLDMIYAIGFNDGAKNANKDHGNGLRKKIKQIDLKGNIVCYHDSMMDAAKHVNAYSGADISKAIKKGYKCKGYKFEYV